MTDSSDQDLRDAIHDGLVRTGNSGPDTADIDAILNALSEAGYELVRWREFQEILDTAEHVDKATISHIDGRDLIDELHPEQWHYCNIIVRINGEFQKYEGDWLKDLWYARMMLREAIARRALPPPSDRPAEPAPAVTPQAGAGENSEATE